MKKTLLLSITLFTLKTFSFGQACHPDPQYTNTSTQRGLWPDTIVNLAHAYVGIPYSQVVTVVIPKDTTSGPPLNIHFNWDSTVLGTVTGLPSSMSYSCWNSNTARPNNCTWDGNSIGCLVITGIPMFGDIGTHPLTISTNNYIHTYGLKTAAVPGYKLIVDLTQGVNESQETTVLLQNSPNPFNDKTEISFTTEDIGTAQLKIFNLIGSVVQQQEVKVKKGMNKIELDAKNFDAGVYFYSIVNGSNSFTRKMVVTK